jgi:shikimate dehydrogenase
LNSEIEGLNQLCKNEVIIPGNKTYAAILGLNPSKGARSPKLWNAVFEKLQLSSRMIPLDIESSNIEEVLTILDRDPNFLGGAIAVPYKEVVYDYFFERLDALTKNIGAVNCVFRNTAGKLTAINTDGSGAISSLTANFGTNSFGRVLVLGAGGTAKAVSAVLASETKLVNDIVIASRAEFPGRKLARACHGSWITWDMISEVVGDVGLIVNCTTIGSHYNIDKSPLSENHLTSLSASVVVYDVIYDPSPTLLIKQARSRGLRNINGLDMNLEQAVIACHKVLSSDLSLNETRKIMSVVN